MLLLLQCVAEALCLLAPTSQHCLHSQRLQELDEDFAAIPSLPTPGVCVWGGGGGEKRVHTTCVPPRVWHLVTRSNLPTDYQVCPLRMLLGCRSGARRKCCAGCGPADAAAKGTCVVYLANALPTDTNTA